MFEERCSQASLPVHSSGQPSLIVRGNVHRIQRREREREREREEREERDRERHEREERGERREERGEREEIEMRGRGWKGREDGVGEAEVQILGYIWFMLGSRARLSCFIC